jgi:hypothetical protein
MLRACALTYGKDWEKSLSFTEFSYNGRKCQTPLMWSEVKERSLFCPDMIKEAEEQVAKV